MRAWPTCSPVFPGDVCPRPLQLHLWHSPHGVSCLRSLSHPLPALQGSLGSLPINHLYFHLCFWRSPRKATRGHACRLSLSMWLHPFPHCSANSGVICVFIAPAATLRQTPPAPGKVLTEVTRAVSQLRILPFPQIRASGCSRDGHFWHRSCSPGRGYTTHTISYPDREDVPVSLKIQKLTFKVQPV